MQRKLKVRAPGGDWDELRKTLRAIREKGYALTLGEFDPLVMAIAAPIFNRGSDVLGSLALAVRKRAADAKFLRLANPVMEAACEVTKEIVRPQQAPDFPARAIG